MHEKGAFFTRGSGHNKLGGYTETPDEYQEVMDRLARKHAAAKGFVPKAVLERRDGASFGVLALGGCDLAVKEALSALEARGLRADYLRVRGFPFGAEVESFLREHDPVFVVEQNRDAQLLSLLTLETSVPKEKLRSVRAYGGFPLQASQVIHGIESQIHTRAHGDGRVDGRADGHLAGHAREVRAGEVIEASADRSNNGEARP
jgi:2-oxoglutarate ferredoxin oxidoreductase subunit alpha